MGLYLPWGILKFPKCSWSTWSSLFSPFPLFSSSSTSGSFGNDRGCSLATPAHSRIWKSPATEPLPGFVPSLLGLIFLSSRALFFQITKGEKKKKKERGKSGKELFPVICLAGYKSRNKRGRGEESFPLFQECLISI